MNLIKYFFGIILIAFDYGNLYELEGKANGSISTKIWINQVLDSTLRTHDIPAISLAIIKDGKAFLTENYGVKIRNPKTNLAEHSIYQIGSLSKMLAGIVVNNLLSEGVIKLEEPIVQYLPKTLSNKCIKKLSPIKIKHLVHHSAGIPRTSKVVKRKDGDAMLGGYSELDLIEDLERLRIRFTPGSKFEYSNQGYALLAYICERVTSMSYPALFQKYISDPYKLPNTKTSIQNINQSQLVSPYRKDKRHTLTKPWEMGKLTPAGGIYSTVQDLSSIMLAQISAYRDDPKDPLYLSSSTFPINDQMEYGLGIFLREQPNLQHGHGGDLDGYGTGYMFFPNKSGGIIILTSSGGRWIGELEKLLAVRLFS